jgi:hypothetical protein
VVSTSPSHAPHFTAAQAGSISHGIAAALASTTAGILASATRPPSTGTGATPTQGDPAPAHAPDPVSAVGGAPFSAAGSGAGYGLVLALLFSLAAFALQHYSRLRLPPGQWRSFAFVAVVERPG